MMLRLITQYLIRDLLLEAEVCELYFQMEHENNKSVSIFIPEQAAE